MTRADNIKLTLPEYLAPARELASDDEIAQWDDEASSRLLARWTQHEPARAWAAMFADLRGKISEFDSDRHVRIFSSIAASAIRDGVNGDSQARAFVSALTDAFGPPTRATSAELTSELIRCAQLLRVSGSATDMVIRAAYGSAHIDADSIAYEDPSWWRSAPAWMVEADAQ